VTLGTAFAYAGSALPVLLLINLSNRRVSTILTGEALGQEVVQTLVGSIGLVLSVPLTSAVGVALVRLAPGPVPQRTRRSALTTGSADM
jgi:uncharacterized membrane protein